MNIVLSLEFIWNNIIKHSKLSLQIECTTEVHTHFGLYLKILLASFDFRSFPLIQSHIIQCDKDSKKKNFTAISSRLINHKEISDDSVNFSLLL